MAIRPELDDKALIALSREDAGGVREIELSVPDIHCASCMTSIEGALSKLAQVEVARVNFSTKRARIRFRVDEGMPSDLTRAIEGAGYRAFLLDPEAGGRDRTLSQITRSLAVSGFAAGNIMLFSVSIWSGADGVTRDLFHWVSALIAVPAVAYAGQPFFRSAWGGLKQGALNMDLPISIAVLLALGLSFVETFHHGAHAYFDASVSLLFFLLIGRTLDHLMREKARGAVRNLARLAPREATQILQDGNRQSIPLAAIEPGFRLEILPGQNVPVDGTVQAGHSDIDVSIVSGEAVPEGVGPGKKVLAGSTNLTGRIEMSADRAAANSFVSRMVGLMEAAEGAKAGYKRIADRAAAIYAPAVHLLALGTFLGWGILSGDWHMATINAIAVLIITCPCALALAVPIVHVVVSGRLFEAGIMMKDGVALERLAKTDTVVFDKTGTLTGAKPEYLGQIMGTPDLLAMAAGIGGHSRHPLSRALFAATDHPTPITGQAQELPGAGVLLSQEGVEWRLGRAGFCGAKEPQEAIYSSVWLSRDGEPVAGFAFAGEPQPDAVAAIGTLKGLGQNIVMLSGDRAGPVVALAERLGIGTALYGQSPADKLEQVQRREARGERVAMVGDGINDAPALRAASVSLAPATAADVGRHAADFIFTRNSLMAVPFAIRLAKRAERAVKVNFALAIGYNMIAIPLAVSGHVTPLVAALAMSSSSILVTLNALTLRLGTAARGGLSAPEEPLGVERAGNGPAGAMLPRT